MKKTKSQIVKEVSTLDFRVTQLEIALSSLMYVVANQEDELPDFKNRLNEAGQLSKEISNIFEFESLTDEGAEA